MLSTTIGATDLVVASDLMKQLDTCKKSELVDTVVLTADKKPKIALVSVKEQLSMVKYAAAATVKAEVMLKKLPIKRQLEIDMLSAETAIVVVAAVLRVKVGRLVPEPKPTIATPATSKAKAVALEMVSA